MLENPAKEKYSSYAIHIASIGSLSLFPFRHVFFFFWKLITTEFWDTELNGETGVHEAWRHEVQEVPLLP